MLLYFIYKNGIPLYVFWLFIKLINFILYRFILKNGPKMPIVFWATLYNGRCNIFDEFRDLKSHIDFVADSV